MKKPKVYYHLHDIELGYIPENKENWESKEELADILRDQLQTGSEEPEGFDNMSLEELCIYAGYELKETDYIIKQ